MFPETFPASHEDAAREAATLRSENARLLEQNVELEKISKKWNAAVSARANYWITTQGMPREEATKKAEEELLSRGMISFG